MGVDGRFDAIALLGKEAEFIEGEILELIEDRPDPDKPGEKIESPVNREKRLLGYTGKAVEFFSPAEMEAISKHVRETNYKLTPRGKGFRDASAMARESNTWFEDDADAAFIGPRRKTPVIQAYKEAAEMFYEFADAMVLKPLNDSGYWSDEKTNEIRSERRQYATMKRLVEDIKGENFPGLQTYASRKALAKALREDPRRKGSMAAMLMPIDQLLEIAERAQWEARRNMVGKAIVEMIQSTQQDRVLADMSTPERPPRTSAIIVEKESKETPSTMVVRIKGKERYFDPTDKKAAAAFLELGNDVSIAFLEQINTVRQFSQALITNSLGFVSRDMVRNTVDRSIKSLGKSKLWDSFYIGKAVGAKVFKGKPLKVSFEENRENMDRFRALGGSQIGTYYTFGGEAKWDKTLRRTTRELGKNPKNVLTTFADIHTEYLRQKRKVENNNRLAEFQRVTDMKRAEGMNILDAEMEGITASRGLIDFAVHGASTQLLTKTLLFFGAAVQGVRVEVGIVKRHPAKRLFSRLFYYGVLPSVALYAWNAAWDREREYWELPDWKKTFFWNFSVPFSDYWLSIPKPYALGAPGSIAEMALMRSRGADEAWSMLDDIGKTTTGPIAGFQTFGVFGGLIERATGRNLFLDYNPVPHWEQSKEIWARDQEKMWDRTSAWSQTALARNMVDVATLGGVAGEADTEGLKDPRRIQSLWRTSFGSLGREWEQGWEAFIAPMYDDKRDLSTAKISSFLEYSTGGLLDKDRKARFRSLDKVFKIASKLKRRPSDAFGDIHIDIVNWTEAEDREERKVWFNQLMTDLDYWIPELQRRLDEEKTAAEEEQKLR